MTQNNIIPNIISKPNAQVIDNQGDVEVVEMSRRYNRTPSFPSYTLINQLVNYLPVEIVHRYTDGTESFAFIYMERGDKTTIDANLKTSKNVNGRVYLHLKVDNAIFKRYSVVDFKITNKLCNYSLV